MTPKNEMKILSSIVVEQSEKPEFTFIIIVR